MQRAFVVPVLIALAVAAGCGSSRRTATRPTTTHAVTPTAAATTTTATTTTGGPGALQAEGNSAAAGDIPDNQVFLVFHNSGAGYAMKYPEGWAQQGRSRTIVFRDKNNIVRVVVGEGPAPTPSGVVSELRRSRAVHIVAPPALITVSGHRALKVVYSTVSPPNPVTGKRVTLVVDRYYVSTKLRHAIVDLGTPKGVDNVDAYRLMIESFRWS